jgi:hypothetical protein
MASAAHRRPRAPVGQADATMKRMAPGADRRPSPAGGVSGAGDWAALVESGIFLVSGLPGLRRLPVEGVQVRSFPGDHPLASIVGAARLPASAAAEAVRRVHDHFAAIGEPFSWRVGPASEPADLATHLIAAGMRPAYTIRAMAMPEITIPAAAPGPFFIRDAGPGDAPRLAALIEAAYPASRAMASRLAAVYLGPGAAGLVRVVVAEAAGHTGLAGLGVSYDVPDRPVMVLAGAGTLPAFRGRGAYLGLLAHRLRAARERGVRSAVVQAVADTSAPILRRHGFADLAEIQVFEWWPGRAGGTDGH